MKCFPKGIYYKVQLGGDSDPNFSNVSKMTALIGQIDNKIPVQP